MITCVLQKKAWNLNCSECVYLLSFNSYSNLSTNVQTLKETQTTLTLLYLSFLYTQIIF